MGSVAGHLAVSTLVAYLIERHNTVAERMEHRARARARRALEVSQLMARRVQQVDGQVY